MLQESKAFSTFAVDDVPKAKQFYGETLGLEVSEEEMDLLGIKLGSGSTVMVYPKADHATGDLHHPQLPGRRRSSEAVDRLTAAGRSDVQSASRASIRTRRGSSAAARTGPGDRPGSTDPRRQHPRGASRTLGRARDPPARRRQAVTVRSPRSTVSTSTSPRARASACSGRTAPASRRRCGC